MGTARRSVAAGLALIATFLLAGSVTAHALPQSSDPSAGANLATAPAAVTITFGERPDPKLSTIKVLDTSGNVVSTGPTTAVAEDPLKLTVSLQPLSPGVYTVAWRTVSAVDGHSAAGSFAFGIGVAPSPVGTGATGGQGTAGGDTGTSPGAIVGRWLLFLGLLGMLGAATFGIIIATPSVTLYRRLLPLAWLVAAVGTGIVIAVEVADSGAALGDILGSSIGSGILVRGVPLLVAGIGVVVEQRRPGHAALALVALGAAAPCWQMSC